MENGMKYLHFCNHTENETSSKEAKKETFIQKALRHIWTTFKHVFLLQYYNEA